LTLAQALRIGAALAVLLAPQFAAAAEAGICDSGPLRVLVTGDDGYTAPGIRAVAAELRESGHRVALVAPAENASGSSLSFNWRGLPVSIESREPLVAAVTGGTPANAVVLAVTALQVPEHRPQLVVSGINDGTNLGVLLPLSGTVGGAMAAALLLDPPIPSIALNAERIAGANEQHKARHFEEVSRHFSSRLLPVLRPVLCAAARAGDSRVVFNVNYPARTVADIAGLKAATVDAAVDIGISYRRGEDGAYVAHVSRKPAPKGTVESDRSLLDAGYVTVTPLSGRYADLPAAFGQLDSALGELSSRQ
jgi:5'-nucleotidase